MGICFSCKAAAVSPAPASPTAKVIYPDGELREFARPVLAAHVLEAEPACFVCDADDMEFDGRVSALAADEELRRGQLYFLLPPSMLNRPLQAEELAALAIRASPALVKASAVKSRSGRGGVAPLVFPDVEKADMVAGGGEIDGTKASEYWRRSDKVGCGKGCKFTPDLSAIPE